MALYFFGKYNPIQWFVSDDYKPHVNAMMGVYESFKGLLPERASRVLNSEDAPEEAEATEEEEL